MKIGCLCVTENRSAILGIALASYETQRWSNRALLVVDTTSEFDTAARDACRKLPHALYWHRRELAPTVEKLDLGCNVLFHRLRCDLVAMWDDDDWSPPDRLTLAAEAYLSAFVRYPWVWSYTRGHFVSLRTLNGHEIACTPEGALWGGCLTFNEAAWAEAGRFATKPNVGYDREFVAALRQQDVGRLSPLLQIVTAPPDAQLPVAFVHGHNVATQLCNPVEDYTERLLGVYARVLGSDGGDGWLPPEVCTAVKHAQQFMVAHRAYPSEPPPAAPAGCQHHHVTILSIDGAGWFRCDDCGAEYDENGCDKNGNLVKNAEVQGD